MTVQEKAHDLFKDQLSSWPMLGANWEKLSEAQVKEIQFDGYSIRVQCNPKRIVSSAAKVDKVSIGKRPCFLCTEHRPIEEKNVWFGEHYEILCNPFPIFREHFTIARNEHTPQVVEPEFRSFLELSRALPDLAVFYNAPNCGASAPDHMHFQAGNRGFMPVEDELAGLKDRYGKVLYEDPRMTVKAVDDGLRRFHVVESDSMESLEEYASHAFQLIRDLQKGEEPMINMLSYYERQWQVLLFPRDRHRPWQYFEEGEKNILLSPASVDMGGTLITPLEKDFLKITREDIVDIFSQVSFSAENFAKMNIYIQNKLESDDQ
jgi:ATP adenylyltransferase/5',5'''-P-1,P-4-tetraphosphate phosphorylase II